MNSCWFCVGKPVGKNGIVCEDCWQDEEKLSEAVRQQTIEEFWEALYQERYKYEEKERYASA